ncbi:MULTISPECIES: heavy metal translocating P-type ATPase [Legionella]|uniref:heavy metal translocating P-type ATPase n=1 Tax=Legionella TaxID=445 RepID=UPI000AF78F71|nr:MULTISPECIES: HAD-IC family P-type ATPase [Legionella]
MHLNYYRFHLAGDPELFADQQTADKIEQILQEINDLQLVRTAIDLTPPNPSISLLCKSSDTEAIATKVNQRLWEEKIAFAELIETEVIEYKAENGHADHVSSSTPEHSAHGKKKRKKRLAHASAHDHEHDHSHDHEHDHSHDHAHGHSHDHEHGHSHGHENHWLKAALGLIWGVGLLALSIASFNIPLIAYLLITGLTTLMTLYLGYNVYKSAWYSLLEKKWDTAALYTISTLTIVAVSIASMFIPGLPMMFEAAPLVLGFWHLGEGIEHTLVGEIQKKLDVRDCLPLSVLLKGNPDREISVKNLIPNDKIIIKKGEVIPVDGILTERALLYTTRVDGSPDLKEFNPGDEVLAGMRLADHLPSVAMRATKTYQKSYLSLIAENNAKANNEKAPVERFANTILKYFVPGLLLVALVSGIVIGSLFTPALAIQCVVSVLVSACPCALSLITPLAVKIGMKKASENGIHFNNGKALQAAADIDATAFDLNGTLTQGKIVVQAVNVQKKYLPYLALLESQSDHPSAKKIKSHIINRLGIVIDEQLKIDRDSIDRHHAGIKAEINGETFMVGNKNMLLEHGVTVFNKPYDDPRKGNIYMVRRTKVHDKEETEVIGQIDLFDPLREDAFATVAQLKELGIAIYIITGADQDTAERYAELLGISPKNIFANTVGAVTKKGCDLHLLSELPKRPAQYKNSYVFIKKNDTQELYYVNPNREYEKVKILDFDLFEEKINTIKNKDEATLHLSKKQIKEIITANGSHTPKKWQISKASCIKRIQRKGHKVAMVGDAANDDTAIATADVGIAVKSNIGDTATQQNAGIVLQQGLLFPIATAFDIAAKAKQNIAQNLFVSLTYNSVITLVAAGLFVAIGFALNPVIGVALMVLESAIVLSNLYLFKQQDVVLAERKTPSPADEVAGDTTTNMLHSLGHSFQPKAEVTETQTAGSYVKSLFAGEPQYSPDKDTPEYASSCIMQ